MSLSYERLQTVEVRDPRTILMNQRQYAALRSGSQVSWKPFTTTNVSSSSISFSCPPPSGGFIVDRKQYFLCPIRLTFTGTAPVGEVLLNPGQDGPRAYPLSSGIDVLQCTINNQGVSINMSDIIQSLLHFNTDSGLSLHDYSMTPNLLDQSQAYSQLFGSNRSPFAWYGDTLDQTMYSRAAFPFTVVSNTNTTAVVDMLVCEPLFLSPFYWGKSNESGFYNVTTLDFQITFLTQAGNRMWSHDAVSVGVPTSITNCAASFNNFSPAFSYSVNQPVMLFQYITPNDTQIIPWNVPITYPYFETLRFVTDSANAVAPGGTYSFVSNNIQLNSIPRRMYVYIRERNADLYATCHNPDTYFSIEAPFNVQWENQNNLFSSATKQDLYKMSKENHCNLDWIQWSGGPVMGPSSFATGDQIGTVGSLICIEFATNIGLSSLDAPGKLKQSMLQIQGTATNISNRTITPALYIVIINEGSFTVEGLGKASTNIGVLSSEDILNAKQSPFVTYCDVEEINGGNFFSGLKSFGNKLLHGVKDVNSFLRENKVLSGLSGLVPHPAAQIASKGLSVLGYGQGYGEGYYGGEEGGEEGGNEGCGCCEQCIGTGCMACRGSGMPLGNPTLGGTSTSMYGGARLTRSQLRARMK